MFRLIGFLFGVVITIVVLAAMVDAPTRERAGALATDLTATLFDAVEQLKTKRDVSVSSSGAESRVAVNTDTVLAEPAPVKPAEATAPPVAENTQSVNEAPLTVKETVASAAKSTSHSTQLPKPKANPVAAEPIAATDTTSPAAPVWEWEPVWRAFRSELSAKGFANHLKNLTGQEYRIRRTFPWAYQVEVAYTDEGQRDAVLREIQSKTGLGLMGTTP